MELEVLVDETGTIVALAARRIIAANPHYGARAPQASDVPTVRMLAGSGQRRHFISLPAELHATPLREIAERFTVAEVGGTARFTARRNA